MLVSILTVPMKGGQTVTFIPHSELLAAGYSGLEDFDVVQANERYFELQGHDSKTGLWWVEEIIVPLEEEQEEPTSGMDHPDG